MLSKPRQVAVVLAAVALQLGAASPALAVELDLDVLDKEADKDVKQVVPEDKTTTKNVPQPAAPTGVAAAAEKVSGRANGRIRLALTLAGGGSRGAAHIGVLKVLEKEGIKPDFISGASIGGLIGCLYAAGLSADQLEELATNGKLKKAFFPVPERIQSFFYTTRYAMSRMMFIHPKIGLYSGKSIAKFIDKNLPEGVENFEDLKIPFAVAAVDLVDTKPCWITKGKISTAVRASNTVPFMYRPIGPKNGPQLVDGGIRDNLPTDLAAALGAPVVVAVKLHSYLEKESRKEFDTNFAYADRLTSIFMSEIEAKGVSKADVLIEPKVQFMDMRSFNKEEMSKAIAAGEVAAREMLPELKRRLSIDVAKTNGTPAL
jgi:NTE family protein